MRAEKEESGPPRLTTRGRIDRATAALHESELVLGRYRPLKPLGSGSSGSVWLALDEAHGLDVALKIVTREGKAGHRAEREAAWSMRLRDRMSEL